MPYPLPLTRTEAYLAYKAGVIQQSDLKPSLAIPRNGIDEWLAYWTGLTDTYPVKGVGKNLFNITSSIVGGINGNTGVVTPNPEIVEVTKTDTSVVIYSPTNNYKGIVTGKIAVSEGEKLTLSWGRGEETTQQYVSIFFYGVDDTFLSRGEQIGGYSIVETTATAPSGAAYARCVMEVRNVGDTVTFYNIMAEKSASATSFEPYTGEPLTLQEEEAYIAYLSGAANEYPEKCLRRVGAYLRYLISARLGRPDHPLNREELYLSLIKTQFIPSGDPSSDIMIDGTAKAAFVDVKMYGDTFQKSYTGKNLLQFIPQSSQGMTVTYDAKTGLAHVSGTNSSNDGKWANIGESVECSIPAGTYTLSVTEAQSNVDFHLRIRYTDESTGDFYIVKKNTSKTFAMPKDAKRIYIWYGGLTPTYSSVDFTVGIQLEAGSEATSFEPYVGGTPSPNPDYPQPIRTVTGRQTVTVAGKNLVGTTEQSYTNQGITTTLNSDGTITCKGTCAQTYFGITRQTSGGGIAEATPCNIPAGTYTISLTNATDQFGVTLRLYASTTSTDYRQVVITKGDSSNTITLTSPAVMFYIWGSSTTVGQEIDETIGIQFEQGSTATSFAPFSKQAYEINLGKNLFNRNDVVNGIPSATDGSIVSTSSVGRTSDYIPVVPNTDYSHTGHPLGWATVAWYKADKSFIQRVDNVTTTTSPSEAAYARVSCALGNLGTCQFEAGEPTSYAPYFDPIELCKLGSYQDYIWKDGGDWKVHKATRKYTFTGDSNIDDYTFNADTGTSVAVNLVPLKYDQAAIKIGWSPSGLSWGASDKFSFTSSSGDDRLYLTSAYSIGDDMWRANIRLYLSETRLPGYSASMTNGEKVALVKTWISNNPITAYFIPRTGDTDTTITDQTLIAQLDALVNGGAEDGTTYIKVSATDPNLPGLLYVEAPKYE